MTDVCCCICIATLQELLSKAWGLYTTTGGLKIKSAKNFSPFKLLCLYRSYSMFLLIWIAYCMSVACEAAWPKNERSLNCRNSQTFLNYSKRGSCCRDGKSTATCKLQSWPCFISKLALYLSMNSETWTQIGRCRAKQGLSPEKNKNSYL